MRSTSLTPGTELATRSHTFTTVDLFLFSAAGWHPHRVHYDQDYSRDVEKHADLLVHGPLQAVHMFENLTAQLPADSTLLSVEYRHQATLLVGVDSVCGGSVRSVDGDTAIIDVWIRAVDGEKPTTLGAGVVRLA
jgi:3-methylfumaryl-CoA hydratase